jgi:hypothetical protein
VKENNVFALLMLFAGMLNIEFISLMMVIKNGNKIMIIVISKKNDVDKFFDANSYSFFRM